MTQTTILTGLRANNNLQLGNYFGAMLPIIDLAKTRANDHQINMFIPDLHSFTTPIDHSQLYQQILNNARLYAAAGLPLDHPNIHLYRQSHIPAHSELTWILDCFTGVGEMGRMIEYKEKSAKLGDDRVSVGLFNYPVLMAADILLYNAELVPVGDDQRQHLEFARDIAERFNAQFGHTFTVPKPVKDQHAFFGNDQGLRIMDLQQPSKKMSKSDESGKGVIFLSDNPTHAAKKIMAATTDDKAAVHFDRLTQPGISNLLEILSLLRGQSLQQTTAEFEGETRYGDFKKVVAEEVQQFLTHFQASLATFDDTTVLAKLETSERTVSTVANATLYRAQQAVGLRPKRTIMEDQPPKQRLDALLAAQHPQHSRSTWQKHIKAGHVRVNSSIASSAKQQVGESDTITVAVPDTADFSEQTLPIIYLDDNVIVINKPAGILTHAKGALNDEFTVAEFFRRYTTYHLDTNRPGIIHRLDRDTSGVMIGARNPETARLLQRQFADRRVKKTYLAIADTTPKEPAAHIDLPIGRNPTAPSTFRVDPKGKSARTTYQVLDANQHRSLIKLTPLTGRTHQLRVHLRHIGAPISGDRVYGKPADRLYLHAYQLEITIPTSQRVTFTAPIPPEFTRRFPAIQL